MIDVVDVTEAKPVVDDVAEIVSVDGNKVVAEEEVEVVVIETMDETVGEIAVEDTELPDDEVEVLASRPAADPELVTVV